MNNPTIEILEDGDQTAITIDGIKFVLHKDETMAGLVDVFHELGYTNVTYAEEY